jgi:hypothetical protein
MSQRWKLLAFATKSGQWIIAKLGCFAFCNSIINNAGTVEIDRFRIE